MYNIVMSLVGLLYRKGVHINTFKKELGKLDNHHIHTHLIHKPKDQPDLPKSYLVMAGQLKVIYDISISKIYPIVTAWYQNHLTPLLLSYRIINSNSISVISNQSYPCYINDWSTQI